MINSGNHPIEEDVRLILGIDPTSCRVHNDGSLQINISQPIRSDAFYIFHQTLVRTHNVDRYTIQWGSGASFMGTSETLFDPAIEFPSHFRLLIRAPLDNTWMRWMAAPAAASIGLRYTSNTDSHLLYDINWMDLPHPIQAKHIDLHISRVANPHLYDLIRALQRSGSRVNSVYLKITHTPEVGNRIREALDMRMQASVRPCRLYLNAPELNLGECADIERRALGLFKEFKWVTHSDGIPHTSIGAACMSTVESLGVDILHQIGTRGTFCECLKLNPL